LKNNNDISALSLEQFKTTSLTESQKVSLMNRIDEKFIFHKSKLPYILNQLESYYSIMEVGKEVVSHYHNVYFDTPNLDFYHDHHRGLANRIKIRNRQYVGSNLSFIEIKRKNNRSKTFKSRAKVNSALTELTEEAAKFIAKTENIDPSILSKSIEVGFDRIALINKKFEDRCTFDMNLTVIWENKKYIFDNLIIGELKKGAFRNTSPFNQVFRKEKIYKTSMSKYCVAMITARPELKHNTFKPLLLKLKKLDIGNT
tara:strand:- start:17047 stop:17817 length:771 start_codon:yes stop_codon:yes gene_type:complete